MQFVPKRFILILTFLVITGCSVGNDTTSSQNSRGSVISSNQAEQPVSDLEQKWGLNISVAANYVFKNWDYYLSESSGPIGLPREDKPVYIALADITGDNLPELFIGTMDHNGCIKYNAYSQDMNLIPLGEQDLNYAFYHSFRTKEGEDAEFLLGKQFYDEIDGHCYFLAAGWNGRTGAPSESYNFTRFWLEDGVWHNKIDHWILEDILEDGFFDPYREIAVAEKAIYSNQDLKVNPLNWLIMQNIRACLESYDARANELNQLNQEQPCFKDKVSIINLEEKWKLNISDIATLILRKSEAYEKETEKSSNTFIKDRSVYLALADITGDGYPEIFVGPTDHLGNVCFTAYTQGQIPLPGGQGTTNAANELIIKWGISGKDWRPRKFLDGMRFYDTVQKKDYFVAKSWNSINTTANQSSDSTIFWLHKNEWITEIVQGIEGQFEEHESESDSIRIPVSSMAIIFSDEFGQRATDFPLISGRVKECVRRYDERSRALNLSK